MDALIALVVAVFLIFVFHASWITPLIPIGGLGFFIYCCIVLVRYLVGLVKGQS